MKKIRWGILSTARIAREKVIPAIQKSAFCEVIAIASGNKEKLESEATRLSIPRTYNSYEDLLNDDQIDVVYIPLPNHLHVPWSIKALAAGKHVLCEKPLGLSATEVRQLIEASGEKPNLKIMEAFMYRFHPQWSEVNKLIRLDKIGIVRTIQSFISYWNTDPGNIRNQKELGGGAIMDIGCYCISFARYIFEEEPVKVFGTTDIDMTFNIDRMASGILDFSKGTSTFTCSTQLMSYQRVNILGTQGRIEIEIPVNAPPATSTRVWLFTEDRSEEITVDPADQYTIQAEEFSKAILNNTPVPTSLEDALNNMRVIEAIFQSAEKKEWIHL